MTKPDPNVQPLLMKVADDLREAVSRLVLDGRTPESQSALSLLRGVEDLLRVPSIAKDLAEDEVAVLRLSPGPGLPHDKIGAIKAYRARTGAGLLEAKNIVEDYLRRNAHLWNHTPAEP